MINIFPVKKQILNYIGNAFIIKKQTSIDENTYKVEVELHDKTVIDVFNGALDYFRRVEKDKNKLPAEYIEDLEVYLKSDIMKDLIDSLKHDISRMKNNTPEFIYAVKVIRHAEELYKNKLIQLHEKSKAETETAVSRHPQHILSDTTYSSNDTDHHQ